MTEKSLISYLEGFITESRCNLFHKIIQTRTRYITVALEDIYQPQNASAVLRTCDCFGIQDVHIIENSNTYNINPDVSLGSDKWLNLIKHNQEKSNTANAIRLLKDEGYRIVATTPHKNDVDLNDFDLSKGKTALLFGTELNGLSDEALSEADEFMKIPMFGFTESFNISVSAAIILHQLSTQLRSSGINWQLSENEKNSVLMQWLKSSIKNADSIIDKYPSGIN